MLYHRIDTNTIVIVGVPSVPTSCQGGDPLEKTRERIADALPTDLLSTDGGTPLLMTAGNLAEVSYVLNNHSLV